MSAATGGLYAITPASAAGTGLSNYTISYVDGLLIVVPVSLPNTVAGALPNGSDSGYCSSLLHSCLMQKGTQDALMKRESDYLDIRISPELAAMLGY